MFFGNNQQIVTDEKRIEEVLSRSVSEIIDKDSLKKRMLSGKELRVKLGIDATGREIHIGHAVILLKLRDFQDLGHRIVLIIGDATGVVGDTSDKDSERPMLSRDEVVKNKKTYLKQVGKIINIKKVEVRHNSEWLDKLTFDEIGEQADQFSVADFIARDNIKKRLDGGKRVSLREMVYPLMQGYDSVAVRADVELGGTDQRFNLLSGRILQRHYHQEEQDIVISPLLLGSDGKKMSKSAGNTINLSDEPNDMYGKVMRVNDELVLKYFELATRVPKDEIEKFVSSKDRRESKMRLAFEIVSLYHGEVVAQKAQNQFVQTFSEGGVPDEIPEVFFVESIQETVVSNNIVASNSEWNRLVDSGAVKNKDTGEVLKDKLARISRDTTFKIGKRRFVKIKVD